MTNVLIIWDQIDYIYLTFFQAVETGDKLKLKYFKANEIVEAVF